MPAVNLERMAEAQAMIGMFEPSVDITDLADRVVNEIGVNDLPQHRMCHFVVLYASQVLRSVSNHYIRGLDARFFLVDPIPYEPMARYLIDVILTESR